MPISKVVYGIILALFIFLAIFRYLDIVRAEGKN